MMNKIELKGVKFCMGKLLHKEESRIKYLCPDGIYRPKMLISGHIIVDIDEHDSEILQSKGIKTRNYYGSDHVCCSVDETLPNISPVFMVKKDSNIKKRRIMPYELQNIENEKIMSCDITIVPVEYKIISFEDFVKDEGVTPVISQITFYVDDSNELSKKDKKKLRKMIKEYAQ